MISVVMTTYIPEGGDIRGEYARKTAIGIEDYLTHGEDKMNFHIADDGSYNTLPLTDLLLEIDKYWSSIWSTSISIAQRKGVGGSLNRALDQIPSDIWMYITDDWMLEEYLNIIPAIKLIRDHDYDYVRLGPTHPGLSCMTRFNQDIGWWLDIFPEKGGFAFATRPFLASKKFIRKIGPFTEGLNAYETERDYAERCYKLAKSGSVSLLFAEIVNLHGPWVHIGEYEVGTIEPGKSKG